MKIPDSEYRALYSQLADLTEQRDKALADKGLLEEALRGLVEVLPRWSPFQAERIAIWRSEAALAGVETGRQEQAEAGDAAEPHPGGGAS